MHAEDERNASGTAPLPPGIPEEARWVVERRPSPVSEPLRRLMSLSTQMRHVLAARLGVGPSELAAMEHLMAEPMGPVELSRRLDLTSAAATILLHRLESSGHVERVPHPTDRRRQVVFPRPEGTVEVFRHLRPMVERLDEVAARFSADEQAVIARYLHDVVEALERTIHEGPESRKGSQTRLPRESEPPPGLAGVSRG